MSTITRVTRKAVEMNRDGMAQDQELQQSASDYAPRRNGAPYLTDAMIAPEGELGDPIRLARLAGPVIDEIGKQTADQIELSALTIVENARKGAETILAEANAQSGDIIHRAETMAADMRMFAKSIRVYTDRRAEQVGSFCSVAESILVTVRGFSNQFSGLVSQQEVAETNEPPLPAPAFLLSRGKAKQ